MNKKIHLQKFLFCEENLENLKFLISKSPQKFQSKIEENAKNFKIKRS